MNLRQRKCPTCRAEVWAGDSDDWAATRVQVDLAPLGPQGEALARLAGRWTFALVRHGKGYRLRTRDRWQIGGARQLRFADVVAEHRCTAPLPAVPSRLLRIDPPPKGTADDCPF